MTAEIIPFRTSRRRHVSHAERIAILDTLPITPAPEPDDFGVTAYCEMIDALAVLWRLK